MDRVSRVSREQGIFFNRNRAYFSIGTGHREQGIFFKK
jgi:hypothetical protein